MRQMIDTIRILAPGESPWDYRDTPGCLEGPWGDSPEAAIAEYERQTGEEVRRYWVLGWVLWIERDREPDPGLAALGDPEADDAA